MPEESFFEKIYSAFFRQEFPADLALVVVWLAVSIITIYLPLLNQTILPAIFAIPALLFIPGYSLIAALFPKHYNISPSERIALSIGLSIAIVPLIGLVLNYTPFGIRLNSVVVSVTALTWVLVLVAHYRRAILPSEDRFRVPFSDIAGTFRNAMFPKKGSRIERVLAVVTTLALIAAVMVTVYMIAVPKEGERFTEFFILGENKMAADYPDLIIAGQNYPMFIGVGNHEYRNITYTIETWMIRTEFDNLTNSTKIMAIDSLDQMSLTLAHNEIRVIPYNLSLNKTGYNRVEFLLFNETLPGLDVTFSDRVNASYQDLNLKVVVKEAEYQGLSN